MFYNLHKLRTLFRIVCVLIEMSVFSCCPTPLHSLTHSLPVPVKNIKNRSLITGILLFCLLIYRLKVVPVKTLTCENHDVFCVVFYRYVCWGLDGVGAKKRPPLSHGQHNTRQQLPISNNVLLGMCPHVHHNHNTIRLVKKSNVFLRPLSKSQ